MAKYLKLFEQHSQYETYINGQDAVLPNVSYCIDNDEVHYNPIPPKATIQLAFTVSEAGKERISIAGDLSPLGGSTDADGLSKVETMLVDGIEVDMETAITKENIIDAYGIHIDGYYYNFEESGQHTIEYVLSDMVVNEGICCTIGDFNFQGLQFPSNITDASVVINADEIEGFSFGYSTSIENVTIGNSVTSIGNNAFYGCTSLTSVTIGNGVTSIGDYTFRDCTSLTNVTIGNGVTSIGDYTFAHSGLTSVTIPNSVTSIGSKAFGWTDLTNITVEATTPPTVFSDAFTGTNNCPIYVPAQSVNTYKAASGWSSYASRIQAIQS